MKKYLLYTTIAALVAAAPMTFTAAQDQKNQGGSGNQSGAGRSSDTNQQDRSGGQNQSGGSGQAGRGFNAEQFIKQHDQNGDGKLSKDELPQGMRNTINRIDSNKDSVVDRQELQSHARRMQRGRPAEVTYFWIIEAERDVPTLDDLQGAYDMLRKLDGNTDGKITAQEIAAARDRIIEDRLSTVMKDLDGNNDGKVSKEEAQGTMIEQSFAQCDENGDGSVTKDELKKAISPRRASAYDGSQPGSAGKTSDRK